MVKQLIGIFNAKVENSSIPEQWYDLSDSQSKIKRQRIKLTGDTFQSLREFIENYVGGKERIPREVHLIPYILQSGRPIQREHNYNIRSDKYIKELDKVVSMGIQSPNATSNLKIYFDHKQNPNAQFEKYL